MRSCLMLVIFLSACSEEFDISGSYDIFIPNFGAILDGASDMTFDYDIEYSAQDRLKGKNTDRIKSIKLSFASLTVKDSEQTLDFLNYVQFFMDVEREQLVISGGNFIGVSYKELVVENLEIKNYIINYPTTIYITGNGMWPQESLTVTVDFAAVVKAGL